MHSDICCYNTRQALFVWTGKVLNNDRFSLSSKIVMDVANTVPLGHFFGYQNVLYIWFEDVPADARYMTEKKNNFLFMSALRFLLNLTEMWKK